MLQFFANIKISIPHFNILLLFGIALVCGILGSSFFKKIKIPQVVGYVILGIIFGHSGFKIIDEHLLQVFEPFNFFALGLISFMIGGELKLDILKKYGKQFVTILLFEGLGAFIFVSCLVFFVGRLFFDNMNFVLAFSLILGSIASATAPAATTDVLWENKTRGPLTSTILGIVAMDDALALVLFAITSTVAVKIIGSKSETLLMTILHPIYEIGGSLLLGLISGFLLSSFMKKYTEKNKLLPFSLGIVLVVIGLSVTLKLDMLMAAMMLGAVIVNKTPRMSKSLFQLIDSFAPPIFILFFVLVGAKLRIDNLSGVVIFLTLTYFVGRTSGKMLGAFWGAKLSGAPETVKKYLPLCLFSQSGVAIGLSIVASHIFSEQLGSLIVVVVTTTTFIVQLIGPVSTRIAVFKAKEIGLNLTEEDLLTSVTVSEVLQTGVPFIYETNSLDDIVRIFATTENLYYPVVNNKNFFLGIITVDHIKNFILEKDLEGLVLACDIMEKAQTQANDSCKLKDALDLMKEKHITYLPVITDRKQILGIIESKDIERFVSTRMIEMSSSF